MTRRKPRRATVLLAGLTALSAVGPPGASASPGDTILEPDISVTSTKAHLDQLQRIASAHGGNRATGQPGYRASLDWVKGQLDAVGYTTTVQQLSTRAGTSYNLIADWPRGSASTVIMAGAHLDSTIKGPGINDNGSGSAGVLEAALAFARSGQNPRNRVRFAFWGAEELGLLGSKHYVNSLSNAQRSSIQVYFNVDMIASPNPGYFVYDDNPAGDPVRDDLTAYFDRRSIPWEYIDVQGRSDHAAFRALGIPTAGTFTGAESVKTSAQATTWGGRAGQPFDPCYHAACDTTSNVSLTALDRNIDALGAMVWTYADKNVGLRHSSATRGPVRTR